MPDPRIAIDPSMADQLQLEAWDALDDGGKLALGDDLSARLRAHGWDVPEPMALRPFGPPGELRPVLQWREPASGLTFSLVPGGTLRPGYDEGRRDRFRALIRAELGGDEDEDEDEEFGPNDPDPGLSVRAPVSVSPFFLATELVRPGLPGLRSVATLSEDAFEGEYLYGYEFMGDAVEFPWKEVRPVLAAYGWSLPTSAEFEWALRGGVETLFYWGDDFPEFMEDVDVGWSGTIGPGGERAKASFDAIMSAHFAPDRPRTWPWCNRFGLAAMLPRQTWCAPSTVPGDPAPLVVRGGAAHAYPWQGVCEWRMLLNAAENRFEGETVALSPFMRMEVKAAIRPAIGLVGGR